MLRQGIPCCYDWTTTIIQSVILDWSQPPCHAAQSILFSYDIHSMISAWTRQTQNTSKLQSSGSNGSKKDATNCHKLPRCLKHGMAAWPGGLVISAPNEWPALAALEAVEAILCSRFWDSKLIGESWRESLVLVGLPKTAVELALRTSHCRTIPTSQL